jgi:hypothetical protein
MDAASKQTQVYQYSQKGENYFITDAKGKSYSLLGQDLTEVLIGSIYAAKAYEKKELDLRLPNAGVCDSLSTKVGIDTYSLSMKWYLPW